MGKKKIRSCSAPVLSFFIVNSLCSKLALFGTGGCNRWMKILTKLVLDVLFTYMTSMKFHYYVIWLWKVINNLSTRDWHTLSPPIFWFYTWAVIWGQISTAARRSFYQPISSQFWLSKFNCSSLKGLKLLFSLYDVLLFLFPFWRTPLYAL